MGEELLDESTAPARPPQSAEETLKRYKHLVDDAELKRRLDESAASDSLFSWKRVEAFVPEMYDRYRRSGACQQE
jgi:hypothetical protein